MDWKTLAAYASPYVAGIAGGIVSLSLVNRLTFTGRILAVVSGMFISVYCGPMVVEVFFHWAGPATQEGVKFLTGVFGLGTAPVLATVIHDRVGKLDVFVRSKPEGQ